MNPTNRSSLCWRWSRSTAGSKPRRRGGAGEGLAGSRKAHSRRRGSIGVGTEDTGSTPTAGLRLTARTARRRRLLAFIVSELLESASSSLSSLDFSATARGSFERVHKEQELSWFLFLTQLTSKPTTTPSAKQQHTPSASSGRRLVLTCTNQPSLSLRTMSAFKLLRRSALAAPRSSIRRASTMTTKSHEVRSLPSPPHLPS